MDVPSLSFMLLAAIAAGAFNLSRAMLWRQMVMLICNLGFLASFAHEPVQLLPYAGFLALGFLLTRRRQSLAFKHAQATAILSVVFVFVWLKQYTFLPAILFIHLPYLVIGLSYVFFRVLHLVIDSEDDDEFSQLSILNYLNFTLNFTSIVSGPIQRYEDYHRMVVQPPLLRLSDVALAVERIVTGLFKIWVVAVIVSVWRHELLIRIVHQTPFWPRTFDALLLVALYPVFLFFNFSGYTDFVIGIARFFRLHLPENFDRPFSACSFIEYWSRWHITLSNWLKTYVYNPLVTSLMRRIGNDVYLPYAGALALFLTFFLIGVWHGRTSEFFCFGLLNGLGMAINQAWRILAIQHLGRKGFATLGRGSWYRFAGRGLTFTWVAFTLLWFWSDWAQLNGFATAIGPMGMLVLWLAMAALAALVLGGLQTIHRLALALTFGGQPVLLSSYSRTAWIAAMVFLIFIVQTVMNAAPPDVVYKNF